MSEHIADESVASEVTIEELKAEQEKLKDKAQRKRLESIWWAAVFIWAGFVFIADYYGWLPEVREADAWSWIFLGAGVLGVVGALWRVLSENQPKPTGWDYFWSILFLVIGITGFLGSGIAFSVALIVIGVAVIANILFRPD